MVTVIKQLVFPGAGPSGASGRCRLDQTNNDNETNTLANQQSRFTKLRA